MAYLNKTQLIGRVTHDPEPPRSFQGGGSVIKVRLAVGRSRKNAQGQWENDPNPLYIDCDVFANPNAKRNLVALVEQYVHKGTQLYVEGRLLLETWDDKATGAKRSKHKINVDDIQLLDGKGGGGGDAAPAGQPAQGDGGNDWNDAPF